MHEFKTILDLAATGLGLIIVSLFVFLFRRIADLRKDMAKLYDILDSFKRSVK